MIRIQYAILILALLTAGVDQARATESQPDGPKFFDEIWLNASLGVSSFGSAEDSLGDRDAAFSGRLALETSLVHVGKHSIALIGAYSRAWVPKLVDGTEMVQVERLFRLVHFSLGYEHVGVVNLGIHVGPAIHLISSITTIYAVMHSPDGEGGYHFEQTGVIDERSAQGSDLGFYGGLRVGYDLGRHVNLAANTWRLSTELEMVTRGDRLDFNVWLTTSIGFVGLFGSK